MKYSPNDLTIVSAARIDPNDILGPDTRKRLISRHLEYLWDQVERGVQAVFVDLGSKPKIFLEKHPFFCGFNRSRRLLYRESASWSLPKARNYALSKVTTPLVAFTHADTWVTDETVHQSLVYAEKQDPFILCAYPWEVPATLTSRILSGERAAGHTPLLNCLAVPHAAPHLASGYWQVAPLKIAQDIGGFDERIGFPEDGADLDFHERARCLCIARGGDEILTRNIPVFHPYHATRRRPASNRAIQRHNLSRFVATGGEEKSLDWRTDNIHGAASAEPVAVSASSPVTSGVS